MIPKIQVEFWPVGIPPLPSKKLWQLLPFDHGWNCRAFVSGLPLVPQPKAEVFPKIQVEFWPLGSVKSTEELPWLLGSPETTWLVLTILTVS